MKKLILIQLILSFTLITQAQMPNINNLHQKHFLASKFDIKENTIKKVIQNTTIVSKTVNVSAGGLSKALTKTEKTTVTNLTITGTIDARDFLIMRDSMPVLSVLDISAVSISAYSGTLGTDTTGINKSYVVNAIPQFAFSNPNTNAGKKGLTSIKLPLTIDVIGVSSFESCSGITNIIIPNSVKIIDNFAFMNCQGLTTVTLSNTLSKISDWAFAGCSKLISITIPNSVLAIGNAAFSSCYNQNEFIVQSNNSNYSSNNGVLFNKNQTVLIKYPAAKVGDYTIPNTVTAIEADAFAQCSFTNVTIPNSVTTIGDAAFDYCEKITNLLIPNSVTKIGLNPFINVNFSLQSGNPNFILKDSVLFNKDETILFLSSSWKKGIYSIPNTVTKISDDAFFYCLELTGINIPNSVINIGVESFAFCPKINSITIPNSVTTIGGGAFAWCGLTNVTISNSVVSIGYLAFSGCSNMQNIIIGNSVTFIGQGAFEDCTNLKNIYTYPVSPVNLNSSKGVFSNINKTTCSLFVPIGTKSVYQSANQWMDFVNINEIQDLYVSSNSTNLSSNLGSNTIVNIISSFAWFATSDQSWLQVSPASGTGNATITLTASENTSTSNRTATVTIIETGGASKTITVTQTGVSVLAVSTSSVNTSASNGTTSITLNSNSSWTATSDQTWLNVSPTSGTGNATITLTASENTTNSNRTATVTITETSGASKSITVTQTKQSITVTISKKWNDVLVCNNSEKLFSSYQWYKNDEILTNETKQYYQELGGLNGSYYVKVITNDGSSGVSNTITVSKAAGIKVYPNPTPTGTEFNVKVQSSDADLKGSQLSIFNVTGELVIQNTEVQENMILKGLEKGYYIVQLKLANGKMRSEKFIVK